MPILYVYANVRMSVVPQRKNMENWKFEKHAHAQCVAAMAVLGKPQKPFEYSWGAKDKSMNFENIWWKWFAMQTPRPLFSCI